MYEKTTYTRHNAVQQVSIITNEDKVNVCSIIIIMGIIKIIQKQRDREEIVCMIKESLPMIFGSVIYLPVHVPAVGNSAVTRNTDDDEDDGEDEVGALAAAPSISCIYSLISLLVCAPREPRFFGL